MEKSFIDKLMHLGIGTIYCSDTCIDSRIVCSAKENGLSCKSFVDCRTLSYYAVGTYNVNHKLVVVVCKGDNEFRNMTSALTEAFYRCVPILVVSLNSPSESFDNDKILNDIAKATYHSNNIDDCLNILDLMSTDKMPRIVFLNEQSGSMGHVLPKTVDSFLKTLPKNKEVFISDRFCTSNSDSTCRMVFGGTLSITLGASLCDKNKDYYCLIPFEELITEINVFGNRHFGNNIKCIAIDYNNSDSDVFSHFCSAFGIKTVYSLEEIVSCNNCSVLCMIHA